MKTAHFASRICIRVLAILKCWLVVDAQAADFAVERPYAPDVNIYSSYNLPGNDYILGPISMDCSGKALLSCSLAPGSVDAIDQKDFNDLENLPSDGNWSGIPAALGLGVNGRDYPEFFEYLQRAEDEYDEWYRSSPPAISLKGPAILGDLPAAVRTRMAAYPWSRAAKECAIPIKAMTYATADPRFDVNKLQKKRQFAIIGFLQRSFILACFDTITTAAELSFARRLVYFVNLSARNVYCGGYAIGGDLAITARHCLAPGYSQWFVNLNSGKIKESDKIEIRVDANRRAVVLGFPSKLYEFEISSIEFNHELLLFSPTLDANRDYVIVRLIGFDSSLLPPAKIEKPTPGMALAIPSAASLTAFRKRIVDLGNSTLGDDAAARFSDEMTRTMQIDRSPLCAVIARARGCVAHTCQTDGGYSGSPMLALEGREEVAVVGVHAGAFGIAHPACGFARPEYFRNYGVELPKEAIQEILRR